MKKILNILLILFIALCMCVVLTGCGNSKKETSTEETKKAVPDLEDEEVLDTDDENIEEVYEDENYENEDDSTNDIASKAESAEPVIDMPENVRIYAFQDYGPNDNYTGAYFDVIKIGNDALRIQVSTAGKNRTVQNNRGYHYFKYKGNNTWDLYYKNDSKDWYLYTPDVTENQFNGMINLSYAPNNAKLVANQEHETLHVDGIGDVDTVHLVIEDGSPDRLIDAWYSPELKKNMKVYTQYTQTGSEILTYDTSVTSFGIAVP